VGRGFPAPQASRNACFSLILLSLVETCLNLAYRSGSCEFRGNCYSVLVHWSARPGACFTVSIPRSPISSLCARSPERVRLAIATGTLGSAAPAAIRPGNLAAELRINPATVHPGPIKTLEGTGLRRNSVTGPATFVRELATGGGGRGKRLAAGRVAARTQTARRSAALRRFRWRSCSAPLETELGAKNHMSDAIHLEPPAIIRAGRNFRDQKSSICTSRPDRSTDFSARMAQARPPRFDSSLGLLRPLRRAAITVPRAHDGLTNTRTSSAASVTCPSNRISTQRSRFAS